MYLSFYSLADIVKNCLTDVDQSSLQAELNDRPGSVLYFSLCSITMGYPPWELQY